MDIKSYLLGKQAGGGTPINNQDKDVTITTNGTTSVTADTGYTGLGEVEITTNVQPDLESKSVTITENTTTTITPTSGKDGLSSVSVTTNVSGGADLTEYMTENITSGNSNCPGFVKSIKKVIPPKTWSSSLGNAYSNMPNLETADLSNLNLNSSGQLTLTRLFYSDTKLTNVTFPSVVTSSGDFSLSNTFYNCSSLETLDLSNFDFKKCNLISDCFGGCTKLTNLTFGTNLGQGYPTTVQAHTTNYTLNLSSCTLLTHDSLMSVINSLADISSKNTQDLVLGATNLAKLSQAEIDIATAKGWTVS